MCPVRTPPFRPPSVPRGPLQAKAAVAAAKVLGLVAQALGQQALAVVATAVGLADPVAVVATVVGLADPVVPSVLRSLSVCRSNAVVIAITKTQNWACAG